MRTTQTELAPWVGFLSALRGCEHSGYARGVALIESHGGELVSLRRGVNGAAIETWRVRFPDRDILLTWGLGGVVVRADEWRVVHDK
jgi:hypothetical protein